MAWYNENWNKRFKITSDNTKVSASIKGLAYDLSNITDIAFWDNVKSDGADIRITQSDEITEVARDIISIDTTAKTGLIRFDTGNISTSTDEDYYLYFENASASEPTPSSTFGQYNAYDSRVHAYFPFTEGSGTTINDRSMNQNNGTAVNTTWGTEGIINNSLHFNGSTSYVSFSNINTTSANSVMLFAKPSAAMSTGTTSASRKTPYKTTTDWNPGLWTTNTLIRLHSNTQYRDYTIDWGGTNWRQVGQVYDGINVYLIYDGTINTGGSPTSYSPGTSTTFLLGAEATTSSSYNWSGIIDEVWIFNSNINYNETNTIYTNTVQIETFWTTSVIEEQVSLNVTTSTATAITYSGATLNGEIGGLE